MARRRATSRPQTRRTPCSTRTRPLKLVPGAMVDKVVFVGHSQGGHAASPSRIYAKSYGLEPARSSASPAGRPSGSPWRLWGAITSPAGAFNTAKDGDEIYSMEYFYSAGELLDGPGHGSDDFACPPRPRRPSSATSATIRPA